MKLRDLARVIRSKNAGPFELTLDVMFHDRAAYDRARDSRLGEAATIAALYGIREDEVLSIGFFEPALAFKATIVRRVPAGSVGDDDVFGAQQHMPLMSLEL